MRWQVGVKMGLIEAGRSQPPQAHQIMFVQPKKRSVGLTTWLVHTDVARRKRHNWHSALGVMLDMLDCSGRQTDRSWCREAERTDVRAFRKQGERQPPPQCAALRIVPAKWLVAQLPASVHLWLWHCAKHLLTRANHMLDQLSTQVFSDIEEKVGATQLLRDTCIVLL
jgi:hypothetical protein